MTQSDAPNEEKTPDAYISEDLFTKIARSEVIVLADDVQYVRKDVAVKIMDSYADYRTKELRDQLSKEAKKRKELQKAVLYYFECKSGMGYENALDTIKAKSDLIAKASELDKNH